MKSILVIDTPNSCSECRLNSHTEYDFDVCWVTQGKGGCPLKPLPRKRDIDKTLEFGGYENIIQESLVRGYNACLEEITK